MTKPIDYADAGVSIETGNALVQRIKPLAAKTKRRELLGSIGGFAALFEVPLDRYRQPVLVSATDGVGTKLKIAQLLKQHHTIGIDLVAMCVNDLIVMGAEPLFFLDYYATGKLDLDAATEVIQGISEGCLQAGVSLVGGETAEMPGLYQAGDYDLAGFCVGIVEKNQVIDGSAVQAGDVIIGLASSGVHSNGYSLVRKIITERQVDLNAAFADNTLGAALLKPTRIYVKSLLPLIEQRVIHAMAHITGGGITENLPRVLPTGLAAKIDKNSWKRPEIFNWLQQQGPITDAEMWRTFNCGIGMVLCVSKTHVETTLAALQASGETVMVIGEITPQTDQHRVLL